MATPRKFKRNFTFLLYDLNAYALAQELLPQ